MKQFARLAGGAAGDARRRRQCSTAAASSPPATPPTAATTRSRTIPSSSPDARAAPSRYPGVHHRSDSGENTTRSCCPCCGRWACALAELGAKGGHVDEGLSAMGVPERVIVFLDIDGVLDAGVLDAEAESTTNRPPGGRAPGPRAARDRREARAVVVVALPGARGGDDPGRVRVPAAHPRRRQGRLGRPHLRRRADPRSRRAESCAGSTSTAR